MRRTSPLAVALRPDACRPRHRDPGRRDPSRYLTIHQRSAVIAQADELRATAAAANDREIAGTLDTAASAHARHVAVLDDLMVFRDRIRARLELATSSVRELTGNVVKLGALHDEELTAAGASDSVFELTSQAIERTAPYLDSISSMHAWKPRMPGRGCWIGVMLARAGGARLVLYSRVSLAVRVRWPHHEDRARSQPQHVLGNAAEHESRQAAAAVTAYHEEIRVELLGGAYDLLTRVAELEQHLVEHRKCVRSVASLSSAFIASSRSPCSMASVSDVLSSGSVEPATWTSEMLPPSSVASLHA